MMGVEPPAHHAEEGNLMSEVRAEVTQSIRLGTEECVLISDMGSHSSHFDI